MLTHTLHEALRPPHSPLRVLVVGAGGNGSKLTVGMKNLHGALRALGHPGIQLTTALSMAEIYKLRQSRPELSLRRFARYAGVPYWQLRDFEKSAPTRHERDRVHDALREQVK